MTRVLGPFAAAMIVVGVVIGSGIFLATGIMAETLPSAPLILLAWSLAGLLSTAGAITFAELGAMFPEAGGQYVYLREAYGPRAAFLFAWVTMVIYQPGSIAALAVAAAEYLGRFVPAIASKPVVQWQLRGTAYGVSGRALCATAIVIALTWLSVRSVTWTSKTQDALTIVKILMLVAFIAFGLSSGAGAAERLWNGKLPAPGAFAGFGYALVAALWTFDGWCNLNFAAGEIRNPSRNIPLALIAGTALITALYLLTNVAYLYVLPFNEIRGNLRVAESAASAIFGAGGASLVSAAIVLSAVGAANGTILTGGRVYYAVARDGLFFDSVSRVHSRFGTPHLALWAQCGWTCVLTLSGSYDQLFTYAMFCALGMYAAATCAVFTLRRRRPDQPRPYRLPGYPWMPAAYVGALVALMIGTLIERPMESLAGTLLLAAGVVVFQFWTTFRLPLRKA